MNIKEILIKHWGYKGFRPLQEEIIQSVLEGKDTLALLPTGGGKSICYQIPALAKDGICLVISPLIALMKDQVEALKKKNIPAVAIYSGMTKTSIEAAFNSCITSNVKLLYLSPERLGSYLTIEKIRQMKVNLLAVDEAHCISQWGYDFRPPYLKIAEIRQYIADVPVLALTATATEKVVDDIQRKLLFKKENVIRKSFERRNLIYTVSIEIDKLYNLIKFLNAHKNEQGIIYVRSRIKTVEIADLLQKNGFNATFYHAGLDNSIRNTRQNDWTKNKTKIIVSTSAFGMGIDKPDVRYVVHYEPTETIEEYFQQAGRAGRDEQNAIALLMFSENDLGELIKNHNSKFPGIDKIKNIYHALGIFLKIPLGNGENCSYDFNIKDFCNNYNFEMLTVYNSLKFLENEGYIIYSEKFYNPSKIKFHFTKNELYNFQVQNLEYDIFIKEILRLYGGAIFNDYIDVYENDIQYRCRLSETNVIKTLNFLKSQEVLDYIPMKNKPQIIYILPRVDIKNLFIDTKNYHSRKKIAENKLKKFVEYAGSHHKCRSQILLEYFDEKNTKRCGSCDVCIKRNVIKLSEYEFDLIIDKIKPLLKEKPVDFEYLKNLHPDLDEDKLLKVINFLREAGKIQLNKEDMLEWKH